MVSLSLLPADGGMEIASTGWTDGWMEIGPLSLHPQGVEGMGLG